MILLQVNPKIPLKEWNMQIPTSPVSWPTCEGGIRRVSVNSFGFGGTNAHVIIQDAASFIKAEGLEVSHRTSSHVADVGALAHEPGISSLTKGDSAYQSNNSISFEHEAIPANLIVRRNNHSFVFLISTSDEAGVKREASKLARHLQLAKHTQRVDYLRDLAHTLTTNRSNMKWKAFCVASSHQELIELLGKEVSKPAQKPRIPPKIGFVFTGQGAAWRAMGKALEVYPIYRERIEEASEFMASLGSPWLLKGILTLYQMITRLLSTEHKLMKM